MTLLIIYVLGVVAALALMRDRWPARLLTALVWPVGPAAFVAVIAVLLVAAVILWPVPMLSAAAVIGALGWWLS